MTSTCLEPFLPGSLSSFPVTSHRCLPLRSLNPEGIDPLGAFSGVCSEAHLPDIPMWLPPPVHSAAVSHSRELEAEIFQLGIRLEELKNHMEQNQQEPEQAGSDSPLDSPPATPFSHRPACLSSPSKQAHTSAGQPLCPEVPLCPIVLVCFFLHFFIN